MKTTLNIHDSLLSEAKALAVRQKSTLTRLIEEGLRLRLRNEQPLLLKTKKIMPVFRGTQGLADGLTGLCTREMLDRLDETDGAARAVSSTRAVVKKPKKHAA